jgi:hypothetical protein
LESPTRPNRRPSEVRESRFEDEESRHDALVEAELAKWWQSVNFKQLKETDTHESEKLFVANPDSLDRAEYDLFYHRLVYAFNHDSRNDNDIEMIEAKLAAEVDWENDSGGNGCVDKVSFVDSIYELATCWSEDTDESGDLSSVELVEFLAGIYPSIFELSVPVIRLYWHSAGAKDDPANCYGPGANQPSSVTEKARQASKAADEKASRILEAENGSSSSGTIIHLNHSSRDLHPRAEASVDDSGGSTNDDSGGSRRADMVHLVAVERAKVDAIAGEIDEIAASKQGQRGQAGKDGQAGKEGQTVRDGQRGNEETKKTECRAEGVAILNSQTGEVVCELDGMHIKQAHEEEHRRRIKQAINTHTNIPTFEVTRRVDNVVLARHDDLRAEKDRGTGGAAGAAAAAAAAGAAGPAGPAGAAAAAAGGAGAGDGDGDGGSTAGKNRDREEESASSGHKVGDLSTDDTLSTESHTGAARAQPMNNKYDIDDSSIGEEFRNVERDRAKKNKKWIIPMIRDPGLRRNDQGQSLRQGGGSGGANNGASSSSDDAAGTDSTESPPRRTLVMVKMADSDSDTSDDVDGDDGDDDRENTGKGSSSSTAASTALASSHASTARDKFRRSFVCVMNANMTRKGGFRMLRKNVASANIHAKNKDTARQGGGDTGVAGGDKDLRGSVDTGKANPRLKSQVPLKMRVTELFNYLDADRSGRLSATELRQGLAKIAGDGHWSAEDIDKLVSRVDSDGDGEITLREWKHRTSGLVHRGGYADAKALADTLLTGGDALGPVADPPETIVGADSSMHQATAELTPEVERHVARSTGQHGLRYIPRPPGTDCQSDCPQEARTPKRSGLREKHYGVELRAPNQSAATSHHFILSCIKQKTTAMITLKPTPPLVPQPSQLTPKLSLQLGQGSPPWRAAELANGLRKFGPQPTVIMKLPLLQADDPKGGPMRHSPRQLQAKLKNDGQPTPQSHQMQSKDRTLSQLCCQSEQLPEIHSEIPVTYTELLGPPVRLDTHFRSPATARDSVAFGATSSGAPVDTSADLWHRSPPGYFRSPPQDDQTSSSLPVRVHHGGFKGVQCSLPHGFRMGVGQVAGPTDGRQHPSDGSCEKGGKSKVGYAPIWEYGEEMRGEEIPCSGEANRRAGGIDGETERQQRGDVKDINVKDITNRKVETGSTSSTRMDSTSKGAQCATILAKDTGGAANGSKSKLGAKGTKGVYSTAVAEARRRTRRNFEAEWTKKMQAKEQDKEHAVRVKARNAAIARSAATKKPSKDASASAHLDTEGMKKGYATSTNGSMKKGYATSTKGVGVGGRDAAALSTRAGDALPINLVAAGCAQGGIPAGPRARAVMHAGDGSGPVTRQPKQPHTAKGMYPEIKYARQVSRGAIGRKQMRIGHPTPSKAKALRREQERKFVQGLAQRNMCGGGPEQWRQQVAMQLVTGAVAYR